MKYFSKKKYFWIKTNFIILLSSSKFSKLWEMSNFHEWRVDIYYLILPWIFAEQWFWNSAISQRKDEKVERKSETFHCFCVMWQIRLLWLVKTLNERDFFMSWAKCRPLANRFLLAGCELWLSTKIFVHVSKLSHRHWLSTFNKKQWNSSNSVPNHTQDSTSYWPRNVKWPTSFFSGSGRCFCHKANSIWKRIAFLFSCPFQAFHYIKKCDPQCIIGWCGTP